MCGIAGIIDLKKKPIHKLAVKLQAMEQLIAHRGPDDSGLWTEPQHIAGLVHRRLSIIDLSTHSHQPMIGENGAVIIFNGEIYNYQQLRQQLTPHWQFKSHSDTETILAAYAQYGLECVNHLRGMFAFGIWDRQRLMLARDRFGIKPLYYTLVGDQLIFASEAKALLPFLQDIATDPQAFTDYLAFQYTIGDNTLFKGIHQLPPAHILVAEQGNIRISRYWDVHYDIDYDHDTYYFQDRLDALLHDSITAHLTSDVPVGSYLSGGLDSSLVSAIATSQSKHKIPFFHGRFLEGNQYNESPYAQMVAQHCGNALHMIDIQANDFIVNFSDLIYHLDYPVAGPGSLPQFMVSKMASEHVKVVLGGQGGDEIFGGYARYLLAYFEQCINAAIEGTYRNGNFIVTPESIIPQLASLKEYKPMIKRFWSQGLFEGLDQRYFSLIDRSAEVTQEIHWEELDREQTLQRFLTLFNSTNNVRKESYFDSMTHFDFKCLLPALLHVEDRVSMAHGIEARVPFLDHPLVEFMATVPANVKFKDGQMKVFLKETFAKYLPQEITNRRDKMGFPVPINEWFKNDLREFVQDLLHTGKNRHREFINYEAVINNLENNVQFSRKAWGFVCLEQWQQLFHDQANYYRKMIQ